MTDEYQISIPPSFLALYLEPGRTKPNATRETITERYELCEDLATVLTETACDLKAELQVLEVDVLERIHQGLLAEESGTDAKEARWVVTRLAELLGWPTLQLEFPGK